MDANTPPLIQQYQDHLEYSRITKFDNLPANITALIRNTRTTAQPK